MTVGDTIIEYCDLFVSQLRPNIDETILCILWHIHSSYTYYMPINKHFLWWDERMTTYMIFTTLLKTKKQSLTILFLQQPQIPVIDNIL